MIETLPAIVEPPNLLARLDGLADDDVIGVAFVRFDLTTGAITEAGTMPRRHVREAVDRIEVEGVTLFGPEQYRTFCFEHFVDLARLAVRAKGACPASLDGRVLSGLPRPCTIEISNPVHGPSRYPVDENAIALTFDHRGGYPRIAADD